MNILEPEAVRLQWTIRAEELWTKICEELVKGLEISEHDLQFSIFQFESVSHMVVLPAPYTITKAYASEASSTNQDIL